MQAQNTSPDISESPATQQESNKQNFNKLIYATLGAVIMLLILLFIYYFFLNNKEADNNQNITTPTPVVTTQNTPTTISSATPETPIASTEMKIYFLDQGKFEDGAADFFTTKTWSTTRADVATFAVEKIIAGPMLQERAEGLVATFGEDKHVEFTSELNCSGKDFTISLVDGKATVKFCRATFLLGDFSGGIVTTQIVNTLKQFNTIEQVRVLNLEGGCFNDLAGLPAAECYQ